MLVFANDFPHLTLFYIEGEHHTSYNVILKKGKCVLSMKPAVQLKDVSLHISHPKMIAIFHIPVPNCIKNVAMQHKINGREEV